jgi:UDP-N-acetylglucosamine:LPS N-acetylglucosamine transferase
VYPALAVAEAVSTSQPNSVLIFVGSVGGFERPLVEKGDVAFDAYEEVQAGPLHGVNPLRALRSMLKLLAGTVQSLQLLGRHCPDVVLLTGGWVGFPVALAAWLRRVPSVIFLPDIEPALSIKVLRPLVTKVALAIPESASYFAAGNAVVTGYPVRSELEAATREEGIAHFKLDASRKTLLVFGGSRGAQTINTAIIDILPQLMADDVQVLHVTGTLDHERVSGVTADLPNSHGYHSRAYLHGPEMGLALAAADLVVSRSGAGVLGEFPLFELPSILVPYPYAWRYQKVNADYLESRGAAIHMADENMAAELYPTINTLFTNSERLATMQQQVKQLAQPGSAKRVLAVLAQLAGESVS